MRFIFAFFLFISLGAIFQSISQQKLENEIDYLELYREADANYKSAATLSASKHYNEEEEIRLNKQALNKFYSINNHLLKKGGINDSLLFFVLVKIGELEHYFDNLPGALTFYQKAIQRKPVQVKDSFNFKPYLFSGIIYYNQNKLDSATVCFKNAEKIQEQYVDPLEESERLYNNLGVLFFEGGNYRQANNYFQKASVLLSKSNPYYKQLFVNYQVNIATSLFKLEKYDTAQSILKKTLPYNILANEINNNLGLINLYSGAPQLAINYFKQIKYDDRKSIGLNNDLAHAFLDLKKFDSAKKYLALAQVENARYHGNSKSNNNGLTLKYLGDLELANGNFLKAISSYQQAITNFYPAFFSKEAGTNPHTFSGLFSYINLFHTLISKAKALHLVFVDSGTIQLAEKELDAYKSAYALIDYVERTYDSDEARLFLNKIKYETRNGPIDIAFLLFKLTGNKKYLQEAYFFDQKNKASVLSYNQYYSNETAPKNKQKEMLLRSQITRLSLKARSITDSTELLSINNKILDTEIELGKLQQSNSSGKTNERVPAIEHIQKEILDKNAALLSYHLSDTMLNIFLVSKNDFTVLRKTVYHNFYKDLEVMVNELRNTEFQDVNKISKRLYEFLIPTELKETKKLIIIPENELNFLPFETLTTKAGKYLIEEKSIQYQYATALLSKQKDYIETNNTTGFAPFANTAFEQYFERLPKSGEEIKSKSGKEFYDSAATKLNFLKSVTGSNILHLATHAVLNDSLETSAYIAFYPSANSPHDYLLYAPEIYDLDLSNTKLVILSACETGAGNLIKGEGVMSLSRAFAYAGCPNVITSLWKADDAATAHIILGTKKYLQKKLSIDEALQKAKVDYLADSKINPRMKNPSYWAHLVFIGNFHKAKTNNLLTVIIGSIILSALIIFLVIKNRK